MCPMLVFVFVFGRVLLSGADSEPTNRGKGDRMRERKRETERVSASERVEEGGGGRE